MLVPLFLGLCGLLPVEALSRLRWQLVHIRTKRSGARQKASFWQKLQPIRSCELRRGSWLLDGRLLSLATWPTE